MIGPGDVVMVIRGHACALGDVFRVGSVVRGQGVEWRCECGWNVISEEPSAMDSDGTGAPLSWLIKINPTGEELEEHDGVDRGETV